MPHPLVVHVNDPAGYDVYIGRANRWKRLPASPWANHHKITTDLTREQAIERYREDLLENRALLAKLPALRGKRLGCWCAPEACHGDVLAEMAANPPVSLPCDAPFSPDWVVHPGDILAEEMEERQLSKPAAALGLGMSEADLDKLLAGELVLTDAISEGLSALFGTSAQFWKNLECRYREGLARGLTVVR